MSTLNLILRIKGKIESNKGAVLLMFALILPIYLSFCALAIDAPLALIKKARLSDGLNEAVLAIAAVNNRGIDADSDRQNQQILHNYLRIYMPKANIDLTNLDVQAITDNINGSVRYHALAEVDIETLLPLEHVGLPSFGQNIALGNSGNVIKLSRPEPVDMIFVVDFSRSMGQKMIPDGSELRIDTLRRVLDVVLGLGLQNSDSRFGIIPYDIGVPVKVSSKNVLGGDNVGCSIQFIPKSNYKIDYAFWADKSVDLNNYQLNNPAYKWSKEEIYWTMDQSMSDYYTNVVLPAAVGGSNPDKQYLVNQGYCIKNGNHETGRVQGRAQYSCWQSDNSIFANSSKVDNEYDNMIKNLQSMRSPLEEFTTSSGKKKGLGYRSIANLDSIDFNATITGMFDPNNIKVFVQPWAPNLQEHRAFGEMCQSGMAMVPNYSPNENVIREPDGYSSTTITVEKAYDNVQKTLRNAKQNTFLIPLTNKRSELNEFQTMIPSGGTDTISGVLRALPELVDSTKAKNKRRSLVIISDGFDSDPYGSAASKNLALTRKFIDDNKLCDKIKA